MKSIRTDDDVKKLQQAVSAGKIRNLMSVMQIQEALMLLLLLLDKIAEEELTLIRGLLYQER